MRLRDGRLTVTTSDDGKPFNPRARAAPDTSLPLQDRKVGGLGIHLVRHLADEISYRRLTGRNEVSLTLLINPPDGESWEPMMEIVVNEIGDVTVVRITGNLNTETTPEAQSQLQQIIENGAKKLVIDFEKLDYISNSGLRLFAVRPNN